MPTTIQSPTGGLRVAYSLDQVDRQIISALIDDGRLSSAEIARRVGGISERAVRYRIDRLQRAGIMRVAAIVNPQSLGFAVVGDILIDVTPGRLHDVAAQVVEFENVSYVAGSVGDGDLSVQIYARDAEELLRFVNEVLGKVPGVARTKVAIVPWKIKDVYQWRVPLQGATATDEGRLTGSFSR
jgi:Lrp/AsnC family transcriptional regulator, regulator for asnA, asnC and gidA